MEVNVKQVILFSLIMMTPLAAWSDPLWQKAVEQAENYRGLVPGSFSLSVDVYRESGKSDMKMALKRRSVLNSSGEIEERLIFAERNGRDITEKMRRRSEKGHRSGSRMTDSVGPESLLFLKENSSSVQYELMGPGERILDQTTILYSFSMKGFTAEQEPALYSGRVWLDSKTALPLRLEYQSDPLPARMATMTLVFDYFYSEGGQLDRIEMVSQGTARMLLISRQVRTIVETGDFFLP